MYKKQNHPFLHLRVSCLKMGSYNTQNHYKSLFRNKDHSVQNAEGSVNYNIRYRRERIPSTDGR